LKALPYLLLIPIACSYACKQHNQPAQIANSPDYQKADSFLNHQENDSAFYYYNKAVTGSTDSLEIATAYNNMAYIQIDAGDHYGSHESLLTSLTYLNEHREKDQDCLLSDYNDLGSSYLKLKDYDAAIRYYDRALALINDTLPGTRIIALNNKALAYQKKRQYGQSIGIFNQAIAIYNAIIDQRKKNKVEYARILSNLAKTRWLQDPSYLAAPALWQAMQIRKEENDNRSLNSSYAHLSDYYSGSRPDSSLIYAEKMYTNARERNSPDDELEALEKLIKHTHPKNVRQYFQRYQYLTDSLQVAHITAKNQFALIRYDAEKNKADNLVLQKDNAEKKVQIVTQRLSLYGLLFVFILASVLTINWYRKRKQKTQWEHQQAMQVQQLKTSQKVHDVVANGLYRIMSGLEHQDNIGKDELLDKIESLYEQSRDISYEHSIPVRQDFQDTVTVLLSSFATPDTKISVVGNSKELWINVKEQVKNQLETVLQELMVNMKKHSAARNVVIRFEEQADQLKIQYTDDGVGLPANFSYGNGLTNTGNRIQEIGGKIIFDKSISPGLKIEIYFPLAPIKHD
jgi:tetratricopeptide (TPR) repeat protein